jgi:hypothetical protein
MSLRRIIYDASAALEKRTSLLESPLSFYSSLLRPPLRGILIPECESLYTASLLLVCSILIVSIASYYRGTSAR